MNRVLICMGSNCAPATHLQMARKWLDANFSGIVYGEEIETQPEGVRADGPVYHNQCALFSTTLSLPELVESVKAAETLLGRMPNDKRLNTIHIDIDILKFNGEVIKAKDIGKQYVKDCLASMKL